MDKKYFRQLATFLLVLVVVIAGIQACIDYFYNKRVTNKFAKVLQHNTDAEVMIFGSSVAYHQLDSKIIASATGKSVYNMGWPGVFYVQYKAFMSEYLSYQQKCRYMVIACDFNNFGKNDLITRPDLFLSHLDNPFVYESLHQMEPQKIFLAKYLPGYKMTLLNKTFYTDLVMAFPDHDSLNGYEPIRSTWDVSAGHEAFDAKFDENIYSQFNEQIHAIADKGIKVVLVMPPVLDSGYNLIKNAAFIRSRYHSLAGKNIYLLDYTSESICHSKSCFYNYSHLNITGATLFSHNFAGDLAKIIHE
jgi:hypothetical protein